MSQAWKGFLRLDASPWTVSCNREDSIGPETISVPVLTELVSMRDPSCLFTFVCVVTEVSGELYSEDIVSC